ncbi:hypothetical protein L596_020374 [Steinernema carpocapsae]|nr:hypothetical protein L596_020374 [Steinernema carpocapsae]
MYQEPVYSFNVFTATEMKEDYARPAMTKIDVQTTGQLITCATSFHTVKILQDPSSIEHMDLPPLDEKPPPFEFGYADPAAITFFDNILFYGDRMFNVSTRSQISSVHPIINYTKGNHFEITQWNSVESDDFQKWPSGRIKYKLIGITIGATSKPWHLYRKECDYDKSVYINVAAASFNNRNGDRHHQRNSNYFWDYNGNKQRNFGGRERNCDSRQTRGGEGRDDDRGSWGNEELLGDQRYRCRCGL